MSCKAHQQPWSFSFIESARADYSLIAISCSHGGFHFSPLQGCSHFLLFVPYPCISFQGSVTPPYSIIEFRDSFLGKYTASKHHCGELYENLELDSQAAIDRMKGLEKQMRQQRDRTELDIMFSFAKEATCDVHLLGKRL
jgi:hypothetical protein